MNLIVKTDITIEDFADYLANGDANQQAEFFNVFFKSMKMSCETPYRFDLQKSFIIDLLDKNAKESIDFMRYDD